MFFNTFTNSDKKSFYKKYFIHKQLKKFFIIIMKNYSIFTETIFLTTLI